MLQSPKERSTRLDELIALLCCNEEVAPVDTITFRYRTGALIARAAIGRSMPPRQNEAGPRGSGTAWRAWCGALSRRTRRFLGDRSAPERAAAIELSTS